MVSTHRTPADADAGESEEASKRLYDDPILVRTEPAAPEEYNVCRRARHLLANRGHRRAHKQDNRDSSTVKVRKEESCPPPALERGKEQAKERGKREDTGRQIYKKIIIINK